jgi:hypothetical protein
MLAVQRKTKSGEQSAMSKFKDWVMEIYEELEDHD